MRCKLCQYSLVFFSSLFFITLLNSSTTFAQNKISKLDEADNTNLKAQAYDIIEKIKNENPDYRTRITFRSGLMQVLGNTIDTVNINEEKTMPMAAVEMILPIYKKVSIEGRYIYAQNFLYPAPASSLNKTGAYQSITEGGLRYTFSFDPTQPSNFFALHTMYHQNANNFIPADLTLLYIKTYTAVVFGVEKGIPVTPKVGVVASLDYLQILSTTARTISSYETKGFGFQVKGEAYYQVHWFGLNARFGTAYWQAGYSNKFPATEDSLANVTAKNSQFQSYRAISGSYTLLF